MQNGSSTGRSVTTVAGATSTIRFDAALPMWAQDDSVGRTLDRSTAHSELMKAIELFPLASLPLGPCGKLLQFAPREGAKGLFFRGDGARLNGVEMCSDFIIADITVAKVDVGKTNRGDSAHVGKGHGGHMVVIGCISRAEDVAVVLDE